MFGPGCGCRRKSDEELLRKEIDTTSVHLYLSAKIALHPTAGGSDVKEARTALKKVIALSGKVTSKNEEAEHLSVSDAKSLALALFELRKLGKQAFEKDKTDVPPPILPALVSLAADSDAKALDEIVDANLEHAVLLLGLTLVKMHPKSPAPIPPPILLYEARWTKADDLALPSLATPVHAVKAYTFATAKLCDLASKDANAIGKDDIDSKAMRKELEQLTGTKPPLDDDQAMVITAGSQALAHGTTAICYVQRNETKNAVPHVRKFLEATKKLGVDTPETEVLRGWVECSEGNAKEGEKILRAVKSDASAKKDTREAAENILDVCTSSASKLEKALSLATAMRAVVSVALDALSKSGLGDALEATPLVRGVRGFVVGIGDSLEAGKESIPDLKDVEKAKDGIIDRVRSIF